MDPVTLGVAVTALVVKAAETVGAAAADAGTRALTHLVHWLHQRLTAAEGNAGTALAEVEQVPDSPKRQQALADEIDRLGTNNPDFTTELKALIEDARAAGLTVFPISQTAIGNQNVQSANLNDSTVTVSYGVRLMPSGAQPSQPEPTVPPVKDEPDA